ncbi:MAG: SBBP repeat-containing protein [Acidobacteriota bacterium]|nr:SBBP repeat-containing protein [Acidobacteriota bacterium]
MVYSTYLGGHEFNFGGGDAADAIAVDAAGDAFVTGYTTSLDFPVVNALQPTYGGDIADAFVTKLNPSGSLLYSTYLGGSGYDTAYGIAVGSNGNAYVTGVTSAPFGPFRGPDNFPTVNPLQGSSQDGGTFVTVIGTTLLNITTTSPITPGVINLPYTDTLQATDGLQPYTWSASGLPQGLTLDAGTGVLNGMPTATGSTTFTLTVTDLLGHSATQSMTIVIDSTCSYQLNPGGQAFAAAGGSGTVNIIAPVGCGWWTTIGPAWITGLTTGTGNGTFTYQVLANAGADRSATLSVAGLSFSVEQQGGAIPGLSYIGSMPHIAAEENWTTMFTLVNKTATTATARLSLFGDPSGTLQLPLTFPQQPAAPDPLLADSFDRTLAGNATLIVQTAGPQTPPVKVGSAQLAATGAVDGFAIFHHVLTQQETVVPLETRNASSYLLAFDNTGGNVLGVAIAGITTPTGAAGVMIDIRDDTGTELLQDGFNLFAGGHVSFVLPTQYPITANRRGTIAVSPIPRPCFGDPTAICAPQISVLGMRFTPPNNALTTIPPLADVGTGGGSMAHIATGNGWKTTFVVVNTGSSAAPFQLNFFADNGSPLVLPIGYPQLGGGSTALAPSVSQTLGAGATLIVESAAPLSDATPTVGSAQLTSSGNVSGFAIFRYDPNGQEAVVPFESRNAHGYLLAFDNTAGTATGVAVNSVSTQPVDVPVVIRNDAGNQILTDTLHVAANGHSSFTLAKDRYPATANIRGTIEFDTPSGAQIGTLAFRIPTAHTFTALPAIVK